MANPRIPTSEAILKLLRGYVAKECGKGLSQENFTTSLMKKLETVEVGAEKNVQSDWSATSGDGYIKNKPLFHKVAITGKYEDLEDQPDLRSDWQELDPLKDAFIKNKPAIHNVPEGGKPGQVLTKHSTVNYDYGWAEPGPSPGPCPPPDGTTIGLTPDGKLKVMLGTGMALDDFGAVNVGVGIGMTVDRNLNVTPLLIMSDYIDWE